MWDARNSNHAATRTGALLAGLHAHTTWSDGALALPVLVDVYGARAFDVLCVTDHVYRTDLEDAPTESPLRTTTRISRRSNTKRAAHASATACS